MGIDPKSKTKLEFSVVDKNYLLNGVEDSLLKPIE